MDYSTLPPREGAAYPIFAVRVDDDGNPVDGVRHPMLLAPLATHLGWNLRAKGHAEGDLYSIVGTMIRFAQTEAERGKPIKDGLTQHTQAHDPDAARRRGRDLDRPPGAGRLRADVVEKVPVQGEHRQGGVLDHAVDDARLDHASDLNLGRYG